ncbi:MAG: hypothetical protein Ct9H300mP20_20060 [Gammaproteobacteria bacterium]|nr:MAG: hypothetical protein Ct9H300mP20_20060 [Gammaproteobacteria bacterium]
MQDIGSVRFKDITEDSWLSILETNLNGAFRIPKMATDIMLKNKDGGSIINIASILAERVGLNLASYASAKAALVQLTKSMALDWPDQISELMLLLLVIFLRKLIRVFLYRRRSGIRKQNSYETTWLESD